MSKLGGTTALAAEAAIWIAGVALIASAAGMHWETDLQNALNELTGSTPQPATSAGASASPTAALVVESLPPGVVPSLSPMSKYQAYVARPDYQFKAKYTMVTTFTLKGTPYEMDISGTDLPTKLATPGQSHRDDGVRRRSPRPTSSISAVSSTGA